MNQHGELVQQVSKELAIDLPDTISIAELQNRLAVHLNGLILHRFEELVSLLYRIDVSEVKIRQLLSNQTNQNAGNIIATLIIERQLQKIKTRQQYRQPDADVEGVDRW